MCWRAVAYSEARANQCASAASYRFAKDVRIVAMVMPELKFSQVERQILLADVMISPNDPAFQKRPKGIEIRGVNFAANILALVMVDCFVPKALAAEASIACVLIGRYKLHSVTDSLADESLKRFCSRIFDNSADHIALTADSSNNASLAGADATGNVRPFLPVAILVFATDKGLIDFDNAHKLTELGILHGSTEPMAHIPSGRIGRSNLPLNLFGADALFGIEHLPKNLKPHFERVFRVLEDGPDVDRKAIGVAAPAFAIRAFPLPRQSNVVDRLRFAASRAAHCAIRPSAEEQIFAACFVGRKSGHQLPERHHV